MRVPEAGETRKQRFDSALGAARLSYREWCEAQGVSRHHLYQVLNGARRPSAGLNAAIDATIEKYLGAAA